MQTDALTLVYVGNGSGTGTITHTHKPTHEHPSSPAEPSVQTTFTTFPGRTYNPLFASCAHAHTIPVAHRPHTRTYPHPHPATSLRAAPHCNIMMLLETSPRPAERRQRRQLSRTNAWGQHVSAAASTAAVAGAPHEKCCTYTRAYV